MIAALARLESIKGRRLDVVMPLKACLVNYPRGGSQHLPLSSQGLAKRLWLSPCILAPVQANRL